MDYKRIIIMIPLAVLAYLLVVQWNEDYHQPGTNVQESAQTSPDSADQSTESQTSGDSLQAPPEQQGADDSATLDTSTEAQESEASDGGLVNVSTDVLNLQINLHGGDITYAALPKETETLDSDQPFVLLNDSGSLSYIARSGLQLSGLDGRLSFSSEDTNYSLSSDEEELQVDLHADVNDVDIIKRFTFTPGSYAVKVEYLLDNQSQETVDARFIGQLVRDQSDDPIQSSGFGVGSFLGAAFSSEDNRYEKVDFEDLRNQSFTPREVDGGWAAMIQRYFVSAWVPGGNQTNLYYGDSDSSNRNIAAFAGPTQEIAAGETATADATLYVGPKIRDQLLDTAPNLELTVDYGWLWFLATPLFWLLSKIQDIVGNWGWSIVLLTCVVKFIMLPLSAKAYKSMAKMRKLGPEMQRIRENFGDDRQKMSQEMMKFYQKEKINPLGGCLPMLVQMPVFIALFWMLMESVELRHSPFILWVEDLSAMDPYFILPILMGLSMFVQQQLNPTPPDPTQAKIMKMLPIIFTFFFLWFPSGLVLYWITNNVLSIAQQYFITRRIEKGDAKKEAQKS